MDRIGSLHKPLARVVILAAFALLGGCAEELAPPGSASTPEAASPPEGRAASRGDFYSERLGWWDQAERRRSRARKVIHEEELDWVATTQDARVALLVSPETGFVPWGVETLVAEIPVGWHTGRHRHGEAALYVVSGEGFAAVDGRRYDFAAGTTLGIPFGSEHQLFNTGATPVRYFGALPTPVERYTGVYQLEQLEPAGPTVRLPDLPASPAGLDPQGRRIRMLWEEGKLRRADTLLHALRTRLSGLDLAPRDDASPYTGSQARQATTLSNHRMRYLLMHAQDDFANRLVRITHLLIARPGEHSGRHAHMEATLYVVQGEGYSVVDGEKIAWRAGSALHISGPRTKHQHFVTGSEPAFLLRAASGVRPLLQQAAEPRFSYQWYEGRGSAASP